MSPKERSCKKPLKYIIHHFRNFENIYSNDELVEIYDELDFYTRNRHRYFSNTTEPATDDEGISLKQNKSYFGKH